MRRILFEIPNAQLLAWIVAGMAVAFALYHAFRPPRKDEKGEREPFPWSSVIGGVVMALVLVVMAVHWIYFPGPSDRIFAPLYLFITITLIRRIGSKLPNLAVPLSLR